MNTKSRRLIAHACAKRLRELCGGKLLQAAALALLVSGTVQPAEAASKKKSAAASRDSALLNRWLYSTAKDKESGDTVHIGMMISQNSVKFGFPYAGGRSSLTLRHRPSDGSSVILQVQGQFACDSTGSETVKVDFDGNERDFPCSESAGGATGLLFIDDAEHFIQLLKQAKKVSIEASFFLEGTRRMEFNVAGLRWDY